MMIYGDGQRMSNKGRSTPEKFFKQYNSLVMAVQFACLLVVLSLSIIATPKTVQGDIWFPNNYVPSATMMLAASNCSHEAEKSYLGYRNTRIVFTDATIAPHIAHVAVGVRFAILCAGLALIVGSVNKILFDLNRYELQYKNLVLHKEVITLVEIMLVCLLIITCSATEEQAALLREFFDACGSDKMADPADPVGGAEAASVLKRTLPYVMPFTALYISSGIVLGSHFITFVMLIYHGVKTENTNAPLLDDAATADAPAASSPPA